MEKSSKVFRMRRTLAAVDDCGSMWAGFQEETDGLSRRDFGCAALTAVAASVLAGCSRRTEADGAESRACRARCRLPMSQDLDVVKKGERADHDDPRGILQDGPGSLEFPHHGGYAVHLRFLPEGQQASRGSAEESHGAPGSSVWKPQCDRERSRHGTGCAGGPARQSPADCPPQFLDGMAAKPEEVHKVTMGPATFNLTLKNIVYDATKGDFPHPNTLTAKLLAGNETILEQEYYSVGGGFIEWKGYKPPDKGQPKYPFALGEGSEEVPPRRQDSAGEGTA